MEKGEDNLIAWIASRAAADGVVGIGDDMAILQLGAETILTAADMLLDGVHFDSRVHSPRQIGRKALAVNLSDCAAMAVRPWCALVSVALPDDWPMERAKELMDGVIELADAFDCRVVGGDTNSWAKPLAIDVTILARPFDGIAPVRRTGARVGDGVFVTGQLGGSLSGHHLGFTPRVAAARELAMQLGNDLHAMMDLSDGISTDAARMATASGVGMELDAGKLMGVASDAARSAATTDDDLLRRVVGDGEDFELLFVVAADRVSEVSSVVHAESALSAANDVSVTQVGTIVEEGVWLRSAGGGREPMTSQGWRHFQ